jgi:hypothetical protein
VAVALAVALAVGHELAVELAVALAVAVADALAVAETSAGRYSQMKGTMPPQPTSFMATQSVVSWLPLR